MLIQITHIKDWATGGNAPSRLTVVSDVEEDNIVERIEMRRGAKSPLTPSASVTERHQRSCSQAISQADFVIIPAQGSHEDAKAAGRAVRVVRQSEKMTRSPKPHAVLLTRTSPMIRTRGLAHVQKGLMDAGIPVLRTELNERDAFKALFSFQQTLDGLDPASVPNLDKAKQNVGEFAHEVIARILAEQSGREGNSERGNSCGCGMTARVNPFADLDEIPAFWDQTEKREAG